MPPSTSEIPAPPAVDHNDLRLLAKVAGFVWWFDDGRSLRPTDLEEKGLLEGALRLKRRTNSGAEYRKAYRITAAGWLALDEARKKALEKSAKQRGLTQ